MELPGGMINIPWKSCFVRVVIGSTLLTKALVPLLGFPEMKLALLISTLGIGGGIKAWVPAAKCGEVFPFPGRMLPIQASVVNGSRE